MYKLSRHAELQYKLQTNSAMIPCVAQVKTALEALLMVGNVDVMNTQRNSGQVIRFIVLLRKWWKMNK
jgi:hypothetical protein